VSSWPPTIFLRVGVHGEAGLPLWLMAWAMALWPVPLHGQGRAGQEDCRFLALPADPDDQALDHHGRAVLRLLESDKAFPDRCPGWVDALLENVEASNRMGAWQRSMDLCRALEQRGVPRSTPEALLACVDPLLAEGHLEEAARRVDRAMESLRGDREASLRLLRAVVALMENRVRPALAAAYLGRAQDLRPEDEDLALRRLERLLEAGDSAGAAGQWTILQARFGNRPSILRKVVLMAMSMGAEDLAVRAASALQACPDLGVEDLDVLVAFGVRRGDDRFLQGATRQWVRQVPRREDRASRSLEAVSLLERHGRYALAADLLAQTIALWGLRDRASLARLGAIRASAGQQEAAREAFQASIDLAPGDPEAVLDAVRLALQARDVAWAGRVMEREQGRVSTDSPEWWRTLAQVRLALGDRKGGEDALGQAALQSPQPARFWVAVGEERLREPGGAPLAEWSFRKALEAGPAGEVSGQALVGLVEALVAQGKGVDETLEPLETAIESGGLEPDVLARLENLAGRAPERSPLRLLGLEAGVRRDPNRPERWSRLAREYLKVARFARSREAFANAIRRSGDRRTALSEGVSALIQAGAVPDAIRLAESFGTAASTGAGVARALTTACLELQDVPCVVRFATALFRGPLDLGLDYLDFARRLAAMDLRDLALKAAETAESALPRDRVFEAVLLGAELAASWRMDAEYQRRLRRLPEGSSLPAASLLGIARRLVDAGRPVLAVAWLLRALQSGEDEVRAEAIPVLAEVAGGTGNFAALERAAAEARGFRWSNSSLWKRAVDAAMRMGLDDWARELWKAGREGVARREAHPPWPPGLEPPEGERGREEAGRWAQECCRRPGLVGDRDCLRAAEWLDGQGREREGLEWMQRRVRTGLAGQGLRVEWALRLLRAGRPVEAEEAVRDLLRGPLQEASALERLGRRMREVGLGRSWARMLQDFGPATPETKEAAALERLRTAIFLGDREGVDAALKVAADGPGMPGEAVFAALHDGGCVRTAAEWFLSAVIEGGTRLGSLAFRKGVEDLVNLGRVPYLAALAEGSAGGRQEGAREEEVLARVGKALVLAGEWERGAEVLSRLGPRTLDDEGRLLWFQALWGSGRKSEARRLLLSWWGGERGADSRGDGKNPDPMAGITAVLGFLLSEGALEDAGTLLRSWKGVASSLPGMEDVRAVNARIEWMLGRGTWDDLVSWNAPKEGVFREGVRRVQQAATRGALQGALDFLGQARGRLPWELGLLARALRGDPDETLDALVRKRVEDGGENRTTLQGAAHALYLAGRWKSASRWAREALSRGGVPEKETLDLLLSAGALSGDPVTREALAMADGGYEDLGTRHAVRAMIRKRAMDEEGEAQELAALWRLQPRAWDAAKMALEAAIRAEEEPLRREVEQRWIQEAADPIQARMELAKVYRNYWKGELLAEILGPVRAAWPGDALAAMEEVRGWMMAGRPDAGGTVAEAWIAQAPDPAQAAMGIVALAAELLEIPLLERWLPEALGGPPGSDGSRAILSAAMALAKAGRVKRGRELLATWKERVPDSVDWKLMVARRLLEEPDVPLEVVPWIPRDGRAGERGDGEEPLLPLEDLLACEEAGDPAGIPACVAHWGRGIGTGGSLVKMGARALAAGRWRSAREWIGAADRLSGGSLAVRRMTARMLVNFLGDPEGWSGEARRSLAEMALPWLPPEDQGLEDAQELALRAHLEEMVHGVDAGARPYRKALAVDPSSGSLRNNLAYLLSLGGGDLEEAIRQARVAMLLSPDGLPWYLETEAWARFLRGETQAALRLQRRVQRQWTEGAEDGWSEGLWHLGRMLEKSGRLQEAREAWRRAAVWARPGDWNGIRSLRRWRETR